jgi:hypothetical protein
MISVSQALVCYRLVVITKRPDVPLRLAVC